MPAAALALSLAAAVVHATWNVLLGRARDSEAAGAVAFLLGAVAFAPVAALVWRVQDAAVPYLVASAVLELVYLTLLARAYTSGEVGVVYPIARGTAPVLVLVVTGLFLSAAVSAGQAVGVVLVSAGVALLHRTGRRTGPRDTTFGLAIGCCIAGYTIVDAHGLDHAAPLAYLEIVVGVPAILYASGMARARGLPALRAELGPATAAAGLALFVSYGLVLLALTRAPAASVAAVRECSVLLTVLLAAATLREPLSASRIGGAVAVTCGIVVVALG